MAIHCYLVIQLLFHHTVGAAPIEVEDPKNGFNERCDARFA